RIRKIHTDLLQGGISVEYSGPLDLLIVVVFCGNPKNRNGCYSAIAQSPSEFNCRDRLEDRVVGASEQSRLLTANHRDSPCPELLHRRRVSSPLSLLRVQHRNTIPFCYGSRSGGDDALNHSRFFVIAGGEGSIQRQRRLRRSASDRNNASARSSSHSWEKSRSRSGQDRKFVRIPDNLGD